MKFFTQLITIAFLFICTTASAHTDHALGEGGLHLAYHIVFYGLIVVAIGKAIHYLKRK